MLQETVRAHLETLRVRLSDALQARFVQQSGTASASHEEGLDERSEVRAVRWNFILVWFMRMLALMWIAKGLGYWAVILGADNAPTPFEGRTTGFQATTIYFAIIDLVAAVGLWLTSTWGGVLWLLAVMSHLILTIFFPHVMTGGPVLIGLFLFFIVTYLLISWLAAGEE